MIFEVASHRALTDEYLFGKSVGWLFSQYERVLRSQWTEWTGIVSATEIAISRAVATQLGKKGTKLKPLPTFDEVNTLYDHKPNEQGDKPKHDWIAKFEQANPDPETS